MLQRRRHTLLAEVVVVQQPLEMAVGLLPLSQPAL